MGGIKIFGSPQKSNIKSIQRGSGSMAVSGILSVNIPITEVDIKSSVAIVYRKAADDAGTCAAIDMKAVITNETTLMITRNGNAKAVYYYWEVIEFNNVKSIQTGDITVYSSITTAITEVDTSKALLFCSNSSEPNYNNIGYSAVGYQLYSTYVYIHHMALNNFDVFVHWQVIEFK